MSDLARIFDPLGFLSIYSVRGKLLVQKTWDVSFNWDTELPMDYGTKWQEIVSQLESAFRVPIPRWLGYRSLQDISLHCFTDASDKALGK